LPVEDICGRWNVLWQLVWLSKLFIVDVLGYELGGTLVVIQLCVWEFRRADRRANELAFITLVLRTEKKFSCSVVDDFELAIILENVLEDKFLLRGVLSVASRDFVFEFTLCF